ncbi:hypothetical protein [Streptomyces sp. NPDC056549]|uniref:hypothetical protein n=1 Tax=Streptomyces sp. NPDC056549 TaxID=3345864 RepID=UPI0036C44AE7
MWLIGKVPLGGEVEGRQLIAWLLRCMISATPRLHTSIRSSRWPSAVGHASESRLYGRLLPEHRMAPHALASQVQLGEWLVKHCGPAPGPIRTLDNRGHLLWSTGANRRLQCRVQTELLELAADEFGVEQRLGEWRAVKLPQPMQVLLTPMIVAGGSRATRRCSRLACKTSC